MSDYHITVSSIQNSCPFDLTRDKRKCKKCEYFGKPCHGMGSLKTISEKNIGRDKMMKVLNIIKG